MSSSLSGARIGDKRAENGGDSFFFNAPGGLRPPASFRQPSGLQQAAREEACLLC